MTDVLTILREEFRVEWQIMNFLSFPLNSGRQLSSTSFCFSNNTWHLQLIPQTISDDNSIKLFLVSENAQIELHVEATAGIKKSDGTVFNAVTVNCSFKNYIRFGNPNFLDGFSHLNAKDIFMDGSLTIFCSVRLVDSPVEQSPTQHAVPNTMVELLDVACQTSSSSIETLSENLSQLFANGCHGDVIIKVCNKEFQAHKQVLIARSPVFASMFEHKMVENSSGVVDITDCDSDTFEDFLVFVYSGKLDHVSSRNSLGLYKTADKYDMKELKEECVRCLGIGMSIDSICDVIDLANVHCDKELLETATLFFVENAKTILTTAKWKQFLKEHSELGNELFVKFVDMYAIKR